MLAGLPFMPFDRELVNERTHCTGAVFQFNSTANAAVSIAKDERGRCFKTIVAARWIPPHTTEHPIVGHLGGNVHVAAPFLCDYGYNLSIAENVVIGSNCELHDSARIAIGMNTRIGNRVTITTMKTPTDIKALKGSNGTEIAQEVFIGKNVYIGDGCIIEAGVRIGDNAIVRAGSVVVRVSPCVHACCDHVTRLTPNRISLVTVSHTETRLSADCEKLSERPWLEPRACHDFKSHASLAPRKLRVPLGGNCMCYIFWCRGLFASHLSATEWCMEFCGVFCSWRYTLIVRPVFLAWI